MSSESSTAAAAAAAAAVDEHGSRFLESPACNGLTNVDEFGGLQSGTVTNESQVPNCAAGDEDHDVILDRKRKLPSVKAPSKLSLDGICGHRPSYLKNNPQSLLDAYDEFKGEGNFLDIPTKGGISKLMTVRSSRTGRMYNSGINGAEYPRYKTIIMLAEKLENEAARTGEDVRVILGRVEAQRKQHSQPDDPFAWMFVAEYAGCRYEKSRLTSQRTKKIKSATSEGSKSIQSATTIQEDVVLSIDSPRKRRAVTQDGVSHRPSRAKETDLEPNKEAKQMPPKPFIPATSLAADAPYVEETAFLFHDPPEGVDLSPLPTPPPRPVIPPQLTSHWRYEDDDSRVLYADFTGMPVISEEDEDFLKEMMQCDYIALVCDGLLEEEESFTWTLANIVSEIGNNNFYHKFRLFEKLQANTHTYKEQDGYIVMQVKDFLRFLKLKEVADSANLAGQADQVDLSFFYICNHESCLESGDGSCAGHTIEDVRNAAIYMTDVELPTYIHRFHKKFEKYFKLPQMLPGGDWCIMSAMTPSTRPFMGPNLYVCPPGGFTHIHQDGHGSVDSGHLCVEGSNEVLMMRRLPERHKQHAVDIMNQTVGGKYSPLYKLPHDDNNEKPPWIDMETFQRWTEWNYVPIRLALGRGQLIHLNKGRLHAFRKGTHEVLPSNDCHFDIRNGVIEKLGGRPAPICTSIAWDWNYFGSDADGINREVASMVETSQRCRQKKVKALAPTARAVLGLASYVNDAHGKKGTVLGSDAVVDAPNEQFKTIAQGILPSLIYIARREMSSYCRAKAAADDRQATHAVQQGRGFQLLQVDQPDIQNNPVSSTIDARGNDYYCKLCDTELSNAYYRCNGCEAIFQKDYMICIDCFVDGGFMKTEDEDEDAPQASHISHCGYLSGNTEDRCGKKDCVPCRQCGFGACCSCRCHTNFSMHMRMATARGVEQILRGVQDIVDDEVVVHGKVTISRLEYGADRKGPAYTNVCQLAAATDPVNCQNVPDCMRAVALVANAANLAENLSSKD